MRFQDDRRAQSIQVGAAILLAFVVLAIAMYQAQVVPNQNQQVEYNHNQEVQSQMVEVRNGIVSVPGDGPGGAVTLQLGTTYPERTIFVNPGSPTGQVRTSPAANVTLDNVVADGETGDYWNGTDRQYETRALVYEPNYNLLQNAPTTVYENTIVYDQYRAEAVVDTDQQLIRGRTITLVTLDGEYQDAGSGTASVDLYAVSTSRRTVAITNSAGGPVTIRIPTTLSNESWTKLLRPQYDENGGHVVSQNYFSGSGDFNELVVVLEGGVTYSLQMAKVGVGTNVEDTGPEYIVDIEGDGERIRTNANLTLVAEVRDGYNNPTSGVDVNASVVSGPGSIVAEPGTSDADGRVEFVYNASSTGTATIQATFTNTPTGAQTANFTVTVQSTGGGGGGSSGPPTVTSATISNAPISDSDAGSSQTVTVNFNQSMDDSVDPTVKIEGISGGPYTVTGGSWDANNDTWTGSVSISDTNQETTATINVSGARDTDGNLQTPNPDTSNTFQVDTLAPSISSFSATNPSGDTIQISFDASEQLADIRVTLDDSSGTTVRTLTEGDFSESCSGGTCTYTWSDSGFSDDTYTASLTKAEDSAGNDGASGQTSTVTISTGSAPTASLTANRTTVKTFEDIEFDASGSSDEGSITTYYWDFDGDGVNETTTSTATVVHDYDDNGSYAATVTVEDDDGQTDSASVSITVNNRPPTANLTANDTTVKTYESVEFDASGSSDLDGSITTYYWDFDGDGTNETSTSSATVTHQYTDNGVYTAEVTVEDDDGATDSAAVQITVNNRPPNVRFSYSPSSPTANETVSFDATTSNDRDGSITNYEWDFGDGNVTNDGATIDHTYDVGGTYTVTLTLTDDDGATNQTSKTVTVAGTLDARNPSVYAPSGNKQSALTVDLKNRYGENVTITAITINSTTDPDAEEIFEQQLDVAEVLIDTDGDGIGEGEAEAGENEAVGGFRIGNKITLDSTATITSNDSAVLQLYEFVKVAGGSNNRVPVDMTGDKVTVTVYYTDESGNTYVQTFEFSNLQ